MHVTEAHTHIHCTHLLYYSTSKLIRLVAALCSTEDHILQRNGPVFSTFIGCPHSIIENIHKNSALPIRSWRNAEQRHTRALMDTARGQEHEVMRRCKVLHNRTECDLLQSRRQVFRCRHRSSFRSRSRRRGVATVFWGWQFLGRVWSELDGRIHELQSACEAVMHGRERQNILGKYARLPEFV